MSDLVQIRVNGAHLQAPSDVTVASALLNAQIWNFRASVQGEMRGPLCGMGICYECRVTIDGVAHRRACLQLVQPGMEIVTSG